MISQQKNLITLEQAELDAPEETVIQPLPRQPVLDIEAKLKALLGKMQAREVWLLSYAINRDRVRNFLKLDKTTRIPSQAMTGMMRVMIQATNGLVKAERNPTKLAAVRATSSESLQVRAGSEYRIRPKASRA